MLSYQIVVACDHDLHDDLILLADMNGAAPQAEISDSTESRLILMTLRPRLEPAPDKQRERLCTTTHGQFRHGSQTASRDIKGFEFRFIMFM